MTSITIISVTPQFGASLQSLITLPESWVTLLIVIIQAKDNDSYFYLWKLEAYTTKLLYIKVTMEQHIFSICIDYRGRHRKAIAIYDASEVKLQQKNVSLNKKTFLKVKTWTKSLKWNYFCHKNFVCLPLQSCPLWLMFVLHKDAMFHFASCDCVLSGNINH